MARKFDEDIKNCVVCLVGGSYLCWESVTAGYV